jgi:hypothetical protein
VATASTIENIACQTSQIVGFVTGAAMVATIGSFERWELTPFRSEYPF